MVFVICISSETQSINHNDSFYLLQNENRTRLSQSILKERILKFIDTTWFLTQTTKISMCNYLSLENVIRIGAKSTNSATEVES